MQIPDNWESSKLGEFVEKQKGKKPKNLSTKKDSRFKYPYVDIKAFEKNQIEKYTDGEGCVLCEDGDFLIVWDGSRSGFVGKAIKGALGSTLMKINFPNIINDYAYYFLKSKYLEINTKTKGSGTPHIDPSLLWNYTFNIPPLPEQQKIVTKIEELFTEIDKSIENLQKAKKQIKVYKQSVLKHAFEGKLKIDNLHDGQIVEFVQKTIGDICSKVEYGSSKKSEKTGKVPVLRMGNIQNGIFDWDDLVYSNDLEEIEKYELRKYDVLFNRTNSPELVGKTGIYLGEQKAIFAGYLIRIHYNIDINPKYLCYYLNSSAAKQYGNTVKTDGVNQSNISGQKLKGYPFPYRKKEMQDLIVAEIEKLLSETNKMEQSLNASLTKAEALKQSVLKKAFEGKLIND